MNGIDPVKLQGDPAGYEAELRVAFARKMRWAQGLPAESVERQAARFALAKLEAAQAVRDAKRQAHEVECECREPIQERLLLAMRGWLADLRHLTTADQVVAASQWDALVAYLKNHPTPTPDKPEALASWAKAEPIVDELLKLLQAALDAGKAADPTRYAKLWQKLLDTRTTTNGKAKK